MRGDGGVAGSQPMSTAVHITRHGAQRNLGDLPPYLTYEADTWYVTQRSYSWAILTLIELRHTLLKYAEPCLATQHPDQLRRTHPTKLRRILLSYSAPYSVGPTVLQSMDRTVQIAFASSFPNNRVATIANLCPQLCPCTLSCLLFPSFLCRLFDCFFCVSGFWFSRLAHLSPHFLCFRLSESSPSLSLFFSVSVPASAILF